MEPTNFFEELEWRGLIHNVTSPDLKDKINNESLTFYIGTDPTADSLHIGHYSSLSMARRLKEHGHRPLMLVGGATGFIGDPKASGERSMLTPEKLQENYAALRKQMEELFGFEIVNNLDWTKNMTVIDFLREIGKDFNISYMINKETVKKRLETGISYTEFSYMLLQAMDFLRLLENENCTLQIGGQDQWGNITAGLELIRKKHGVQAYGLTMPLITKADGEKFGKSETGTIWLSPEKTSPYQLYQFLVNTEDEKVIEYLKKLTFLSRPEIEELEIKQKEKPFLREAQKALAAEVVRDLHGQEALDSALRITQAIFKGNILDLSEAERSQALEGLEQMSAPAGKLEDVLVASGIAPSKRQAREWIRGNSIAVNGQKWSDPEALLNLENALAGNKILIKRGKRNNYSVTLEV